MKTTTERVMIDIETLGTDPGCAILSIGAVQFDTEGLGDEFYQSVSLTSCERAGLEIDAETLEWWLGQDDDALEALTGGESLTDALVGLWEWLADCGEDPEIWANSPSFDCQILEHAYDAIGYEVPWDFWQERDFRTLKKLPLAVEVDTDGTEHDALDDARAQARVASATLRRMEEVGARVE